MERENSANGNGSAREAKGKKREREGGGGMENEYDISHCAERVGLVSLRLHTKSHVVSERCSELFPIGCLVEKKNSAMRWRSRQRDSSMTPSI